MVPYRLSWGIFTLLHHLLVQQAAYLVDRKVRWFSNYAILGDDLVIGCPKVAKQYRRIVRLIGVDISLEKSMLSGRWNLLPDSFRRGTDLSPVSFRALSASRESASQIWSFFTRVAEFRQVRLSEFFRVGGAGYRICGMIGRPYWLIGTLPKRWFRRWLLVHHPYTPWGLLWYWWLQAGRRNLIPPVAIGVLHFQLVLVSPIRRRRMDRRWTRQIFHIWRRC